jgi:hypothetical protein
MFSAVHPFKRFIWRALLITSLCSAVPALAITVPLSGWAATDDSQKTWADANGACLLSEQQLTQPYAGFDSAEAARAFALKVQSTLAGQSEGGQKLTSVVTQPVDRAGAWTIMATYLFVQQDVSYRATQLFLSDGGKLRTVTGSNTDGEASTCVSQMQEYLRYLAD